MGILVSEFKLLQSTGRLGGAITATEAASGVTGNVYDTFSGAETTAGGTFYACLYIKNTHGTLEASAVSVVIDSETNHPGVNISVGLGAAGLNGTEATIANENTAPAGVTFTDTDTTTTGAETADAALALPNLAAGDYHPVWFRMVIDAATTAKTGYTANLKVNYDSAE